MGRTKSQAFRSPSLTGNRPQDVDPPVLAKRVRIVTTESTPLHTPTITARMCFMAFLSSKKFPSQSRLLAKGWNDALYEGAVSPDLDPETPDSIRDERWYTASLILRQKPPYLESTNARLETSDYRRDPPDFWHNRERLLRKLFLPSPAPSPAPEIEPVLPYSPPPPSPMVERTVPPPKQHLTRATDKPYVYKPKVTAADTKQVPDAKPWVVHTVVKRRPGRPPGAKNKNLPQYQPPALPPPSEAVATSSPSAPVRARRRTVDRDMHETLNLIRHIEADTYMEGRPKRRKMLQPNYVVDTSSPPAAESSPSHTRGHKMGRRRPVTQREVEEEWDPEVEEGHVGNTMGDQTNARGRKIASKPVGRLDGVRTGPQNAGPGSLIGVILERRPRGRPRRSTVPQPIQNPARSAEHTPLARSSSSGNIPLSLMADCILETTDTKPRRSLVVDGKFDPGDSSLSSIESIESDSPSHSHDGGGPTASSSHTTMYTSPSVQLLPVPKASIEDGEISRARSASTIGDGGIDAEMPESRAVAVVGVDGEIVEVDMSISDPEPDITSRGEETEDELEFEDEDALGPTI